MNRTTALGIVVLASAIACQRAVAPVTDTLRPVLGQARIYYDDGPAYRDSVRIVVRDINMWATVWARATSTQRSAPPLPAVDFGSEMVLVVGAGKMSPGDQIRVDSAGVRRGYFVAVVRIITDCRPMPAEAFPLEIVRVPRSDRTATFVERRERAANCD